MQLLNIQKDVDLFLSAVSSYITFDLVVEDHYFHTSNLYFRQEQGGRRKEGRCLLRRQGLKPPYDWPDLLHESLHHGKLYEHREFK